MIAIGQARVTVGTENGKERFAVTRLTVRVPDVRGFQRTYEAAVPEVPNERMSALLKEGAPPWSEMVELVDASAPHGFLIFAAHDVHPLMQAAGDDAAIRSPGFGRSR